MKLYPFLLLLIIVTNTDGQSEIDKAGKLYSEYLSAKKLGQFFTAIEYLEEILTCTDSLPDYNLALVHNGLGTINWKLGKYMEAMLYYDLAKASCSLSDLKSKNLLALIYNNQAILFKQIGENYIALEHYDKAEAILEDIPKRDLKYFDQYSMILLNKALVYYKLEDHYEAIHYYTEAIEIKKKYDLPYLGGAYYNLARCYERLSKTVLSEEYYFKSIEKWISDHDSSYYELANVYLEYGQFLIDQGKPSIGLDYYNLALENYLVNYGPNHTYTASCYNLIAIYHFEQEDYQNALNYLQKALVAVCLDFNDTDIYSNPASMESLLDLRLLKIYRSKIQTLVKYANSFLPIETDGRTSVEKTSYKSQSLNESLNISKSSKQSSTVDILNFALETNQEAVDVLHRIQNSYQSQESRLYLAENQKDVFIDGIEIALQLFDITGENRYKEIAYQFTSIGKTLELNYEIQEKNNLYLSSLPDSISNSIVKIKESIDSYTNLIQMERIKAESESVKISLWKEKRFDLRRSYELLYDEVFGSRAITISYLAQFNEESLSDLQSKIRRNETIVEYSISNSDDDGNRKLYAFVITKKDCHIYQDILDTKFTSDIAYVHKNLNEHDHFSSDNSETYLLERSLNNLFSNLVDPIEQWFTGRRLTIIPEEQLVQVPFGALLRGSINDRISEINQPYLIRDYEIRYAPNSTFINNERNPLLKRTPQIKVIAQDYSDQDINEIQYLSSVSDEVETILNIMKGEKVPSSFTKKEVLREIENGDLLHFALHSYPTDIKRSSSYMVLNQMFDSVYSNLLFDYEIDPLNLSASLVVMNVCESGSGKLYSGEGMLSLSRSFMIAGAKSVAHTLWPVDDQASNSIITDFYKGISKGWSKTRSLQKAKLNYLEESSPAFSHPYYWAGYQLVGDSHSLILLKQKILACCAVFVVLALLLRYKYQ